MTTPAPQWAAHCGRRPPARSRSEKQQTNRNRNGHDYAAEGVVHHRHLARIRPRMGRSALERGDRVAATARNIESLKALTDSYGDRVLALQLDVTDKAAVDTAVAHAHEHFGRLDVVVNNAGYGLFGTIEEVSEDEARAQIETNLFGALWVTKAALPILRAQGSGHFVQVSSIGGLMAFPNLGLYHASKWAVEAFSQSLALEVAPFGLHVTIVEPTGYSTDWSGDSAVNATPIDVYEPARAARAARVKPGMVGDPPPHARRSSRSSTPTNPRCASSSAAARSNASKRSTASAWTPGTPGRTCPSGHTEARSSSSLVRAGVRPDGPRPVWCTQAPPPGGPLGTEPACVRLSRSGLSRCTATITGIRPQGPAPRIRLLGPTALSGPTTRTGRARSPRALEGPRRRRQRSGAITPPAHHQQEDSRPPAPHLRSSSQPEPVRDLGCAAGPCLRSALSCGWWGRWGRLCPPKPRTGTNPGLGFGVFGALSSVAGGHRDPREDGLRLHRIGAEPGGQVLSDGLGDAAADGSVAQSAAGGPSNSG